MVQISTIINLNEGNTRVRSHKNVIELNGKLYDTVTGSIVDSNPQTADTKKSHRATATQKGLVMDGVVHKPSVLAPPAKPIHVTTHQQHSKTHAPATKAKAHHPQRSKTLVRHGLAKPIITTQPEQTKTVAPKVSKAHMPIDHLKSSQTIQKSNKISRFGSAIPGATVTKRTEPLEVTPAPDHNADSKAHTNASNQAHNYSKKGQTSEKMVTEAIRNARTPQGHTVHHKSPKKHRVAKRLGVSPRLLRYGSGALAVLLIAGFIALQNAPNLSVKLASTRAGFNAHMPGYQPGGFALSGPIEYGPGQVTLNFKSNSDERNFHVVQRVSDWNSEALLTNFVTPNHKSYLTREDNGRTVYIYDGSNATWVNGGVWYQVEGNSSLSSDQLIRIVNSI